MFGRTSLDSDAYLVESDQAKHVQDELTRLHDQLTIHESRAVDNPQDLAIRLRDLYREMMRLDIPYEQWSLLELMARRFERRLLVDGIVSGMTMPLDKVPDALHRDPSSRPDPVGATMDPLFGVDVSPRSSKQTSTPSAR